MLWVTFIPGDETDWCRWCWWLKRELISHYKFIILKNMAVGFSKEDYLISWILFSETGKKSLFVIYLYYFPFFQKKPALKKSFISVWDTVLGIKYNKISKSNFLLTLEAPCHCHLRFLHFSFLILEDNSLILGF